MIKSGILTPQAEQDLSAGYSVLERAGEWFLRSGIQDPNGGVARYYRSDLGRNAPISNEITGYAVSFLVYVHQRTREAKYLEAAVRAARYLTRTAWNPELQLFPFEPGSSLAYFFDSGIIVRGLLAAWRATQEPEFLDVTIAAGHGMKQFGVEDELAPILSLSSRQPLPYEPRWSASPGCYQLKAAMAWHDLFEVTRDPAFSTAYNSALAAALREHDSFLPGDPRPERVMDRLHAYAYFLEGLLPVAERPECRGALLTGIGRMASHLREIAPTFVRSDVYGQLLRIRLFAAEGAEEEAAGAVSFQLDSGGFGFGRQAGKAMPFVNPVSTAFCAQAIDMWRERPALDRRALV